MIVRLLGEGQFRVPAELLDELNKLDDDVMRAVEAGDERGLWQSLQALADAVRKAGKKLSDEELVPSDAIVPPEDLSLDEARELLSDEGFIPDLSVGTS
jgi:PspA-Associated protein